MSDDAHPNAVKVRELLGWSQADAQKAADRIGALEAERDAAIEQAGRATRDYLDRCQALERLTAEVARLELALAKELQHTRDTNAALQAINAKLDAALVKP